MRSFTKRRIRIWQMSSYKNHPLRRQGILFEKCFLPIGIKRGGKMIGKRTAIWKREEYSYESEERDIPYVISYMHEDGQIRPAMIVVPGGAYRQVSSSEGDIVARTFYRAGYNALVLTYSVNPTSEGEPLHLQPLRDLARTVRLVRYYAKQCRIDPEKVAVCGFSAGGHLCGSLGVHFQDIKKKFSLKRSFMQTGCDDTRLSGNHFGKV